MTLTTDDGLESVRERPLSRRRSPLEESVSTNPLGEWESPPDVVTDRPCPNISGPGERNSSLLRNHGQCEVSRDTLPRLRSEVDLSVEIEEGDRVDEGIEEMYEEDFRQVCSYG